MLDVSRLEARKMEPNRTTSDLVEIARETISTLRPLAGTRVLHLDAPPALAAAVDRDLIRRVLMNLVGNAIKFTKPSGDIHIVVGCNHGQARVAVCDQGVGIAPEDQSKIFEKFGQTTAGARRGGSGLGLAFCRLAVEAHGGSIGVESTPDCGSTFWFSLPTAKCAAASATN